MSSRVEDHDRGAKKLMKQVHELARAPVYVKVGILAQTASRQGAEGLTNVQVGAIHEFGAPDRGIPQRSFLRATFDAQRTRYQKQLAKVAKLAVEGKVTPKDGLALLGMGAAEDVRNRIRSGIPPALAAETVRRKGSSTPLIDTGQLLGAITSAVVEGEPPAKGGS